MHHAISVAPSPSPTPPASSRASAALAPTPVPPLPLQRATTFNRTAAVTSSARSPRIAPIRGLLPSSTARPHAVRNHVNPTTILPFASPRAAASAAAAFPSPLAAIGAQPDRPSAIATHAAFIASLAQQPSQELHIREHTDPYRPIVAKEHAVVYVDKTKKSGTGYVIRPNFRVLHQSDDPASHCALDIVTSVPPSILASNSTSSSSSSSPPSSSSLYFVRRPRRGGASSESQRVAAERKQAAEDYEHAGLPLRIGRRSTSSHATVVAAARKSLARPSQSRRMTSEEIMSGSGSDMPTLSVGGSSRASMIGFLSPKRSSALLSSSAAAAASRLSNAMRKPSFRQSSVHAAPSRSTNEDAETEAEADMHQLLTLQEDGYDDGDGEEEEKSSVLRSYSHGVATSRHRMSMDGESPGSARPAAPPDSPIFRTLNDSGLGELRGDVIVANDDVAASGGGASGAGATCCICATSAFVEPWIAECNHICCSECWITWLNENTEKLCPECDTPIRLEELRSVALCPICAKLPTRPWKGPCQHVACHECWKQWLSENPVCPECSQPIDKNMVPV